MADKPLDAARPTAGSSIPLWLTLAPAAFLIFWSAGYTGVKIALRDCEPIVLLAVRYLGVLALLIPAYAIWRPPLPVSGRQWLNLIVVGVLVQGLYFGGTNIAIKLGVSAVGMTIILALQPIIVALVAPYTAGERVGVTAWAGLMLGLTGAVVAALAKDGSGAGTVEGIIATSFALIFIASGTLYEKRFGGQHHPVVANLIQCAAALAVAIPAAALLEDGRITWTLSFIASTAYLVIFNSILAMTLLFAMIQRGAASRVTALFFLVPPSASIIAWAILGEDIPALTWVGMAIAGAGLLLVGSPMRRSS